MSTRQRRWAGAIGALLLTTGAGIAALSTPAGAAGPGEVDLTLLNINDWHGRIDPNTVRFAGTIEGLRAAAGEANTALLSAGDNIGASLFASALAQDQPTIDILNALDLKTSAVGNHEFDGGFADLTDRVIAGRTNARWSYLGANVYQAGTTTPALPEYDVFTLGGIQVGVIGVVTSDTPSLVSPSGVAMLTFGNPVEAVNRVAAQLSDGNAANGEADVIIAEYHDGATDGVAENATLEQEIAAGGIFASIVQDTSAQVDAIFTGHTHKEYAWDGPVPGQAPRTRPILQTGSYGDRIGKIVLTVNETTKQVVAYTSQNVARVTTPDATLVATYPRVAAVKAIADVAIANATVVGSRPVGTQAGEITTAFLGGSVVNGVYTGGARDDRAKESTLGNLIADSLLDTLSDPARGGADIGVMNPGGLRQELRQAASALTPGDAAGLITFGEVNAVLPFANSLFTVTLTGEQFKTLLEQQWQRLPNGTVPSRPYLQLGLSSNVSYTFDAALPEGSRITSISIDGAPIDPAGTYRVGSNSFLIDGGDNFRVLAQGTDERDSGLIDRDAFATWVGANSPIAPSFAKRSAVVSPVPTAASVGQSLAFAVSQLDLTSISSPANTTLAVSIGGTSLGSVPVTAGAATVALTVPVGTPVGAQTLTLVASPSGTTVTLPITVTDTRVVSTTTLTTSTATQTFGSPATATLTATVALADGTVPTGSVDLVANGSVVATLPLTNGVATYTVPATTPAGSLTFRAVYADTNAVKGSASADVTVTVSQARSSTLLWTDRFIQQPNGRPATLTAYVLLNTPAVAEGTVTFRQNGRIVATVAVVNGQASYTLPTTLRRTLVFVTAEYTGTPSIKGSGSNPIPILVR